MAQTMGDFPAGARIAPVARYSAVGAVARQLLDHLTSGNFAVGTRLPRERALATSRGRSKIHPA